jgi:hypothetical protein
MANTFKNETLRASGTTLAPVGSAVASSTQTTIIGMTVANIVSSVISVGVKLVDNSANETWLVKDAPIPTGGALVVVGGDQKVVMETGDIIKVISNTASSMDVVMSYLEIT